MKPSAAFAAGLWTGALVVAGLAALHFRPWEQTRANRISASHGNQTAAVDPLHQLQQENARLIAEAARLRETVADLRSNVEVRTAIAPRRVPFREPRIPEAPPATADWIEQAVSNADVKQLSNLEALALRNNSVALEALALMAEQDAAEALTRVWKSGQLNVVNQILATQYLAATMEVNVQGEELLRALFAMPATDVRILQAAADGIASPVFPITLGRNATIMPPPHFTPDYASRAQLLESLQGAVVDQRLRASMERARTELARRAAQAEPLAP